MQSTKTPINEKVKNADSYHVLICRCIFDEHLQSVLTPVTKHDFSSNCFIIKATPCFKLDVFDTSNVNSTPKGNVCASCVPCRIVGLYHQVLLDQSADGRPGGVLTA